MPKDFGTAFKSKKNHREILGPVPWCSNSLPRRVLVGNALMKGLTVLPKFLSHAPGYKETKDLLQPSDIKNQEILGTGHRQLPNELFP